MPQKIVEKRYITDPTFIVRQTDEDGQPYTDGNVHGDEAFSPVPIDAVFDENGGTLTRTLNEIRGEIALAGANDYADCLTDGATAAKTVDVDGFILYDGKDAMVNFTNANTADTLALTLNVSGTGTHPILNKNNLLPTDYVLYGDYRLTFRNNAWNIEGDLNVDTDTTYPAMTVDEALAGTGVDLRTVRPDYFNQSVTSLTQDLIAAALAGYDINDLQSKLVNLIFKLIAAGVIDGDGLDTVVTIDDLSDITLISGMYANGRGVYI